jgi:glycosyltransferase involved in cell wall biosynthesis
MAAERHLITSEYPPQPGGVSDYTHMVAAGLAAAGDEVHVWCPPAKGETPSVSGVFVHRELGGLRASDWRHVGRLLNRFHGPRRILVQWVPHGFGYQSMNLPFCLWLWHRAIRRRDRVEVMVHEPYLPFGNGSWKQSVVAMAHRLMTIVLLNAAHRIWMSIPAWEARWRPYALGRSLPFRWLPVASNIPVVDNPAGVKAIRERYALAEGSIIGHFGTCDRYITELLLNSVPALLRGCPSQTIVLLGRGSELVRDELIRRQPELAGRVHATGALNPADLSMHISACDLMIQPYIDGVSSRRTSVMVALSHGVPIITTSGNLTEALWGESGAVTLIPVGDVMAMVNAARRLVSDPAARAGMSKAAKSLYDERFEVKRIISALREATT